jgi:hypothetical protein
VGTALRGVDRWVGVAAPGNVDPFDVAVPGVASLTA